MTAPTGELERFAVLVGRVLRIGVLVSSVFLALGLAAWALDLGAADPLLQVGLFCLMGTPVVRLLASLVEYVRTQEWFFAGMTLAVVVVLTATGIYAVYGR